MADQKTQKTQKTKRKTKRRTKRISPESERILRLFSLLLRPALLRLGKK